MKNKIFLLCALIMLAYPVLAEQCLTSVDATTSVTSNVSTGTNVQISVTPSGSCSSGEVTLQLTYSNCSLTITDPASPGYYSGVSTGTAKVFTVTSGSYGVCTITARGTTSDGTVDDNTPVILEFIDPSSLIVAGAPVSASAVHGASFTLGVNVTNPQASSVLISYALSLPSEFTKSAGDQTTGSVTIYGGGVNTFQWTITHSTCFTGSKDVTFQLGDNTNAFATTVTGNSSCGSSSSNSSSSNNNAGVATNLSTKETKTISTAADTSVVLAFTQVTSPGITQIEIKTTTAKAGVQISLAPDTKPAAAPDILTSTDGKVYSYANISKENVQDSDFSLIKIKFKVPVLWMNTNGIDYTKVYMYRYVGSSWNRLTTTFKSNDSTNYFYEATSPGFSTFAVAGYKPAASVPTSTTVSAPSISIIVPAPGQSISSSSVNVQLSASGVTLAEPKTNLVSGEGHFRVTLDGANEKEGPQTTFTYDNVSLGSHTVSVELRTSNRSSFSPPVTTSVTFNVIEATVQSTPPAFNVDITIIAIGVVLLGVIGAGVYFGFMKGDAKAAKIASGLPKRASKAAEGGPKVRLPKNFGKSASNAAFSIAADIGSGLQSLADKLPKKQTDKAPDGGFSSSYEFRGEVNYQSYSPDAVEASAKKDEKKDDSAGNSAAPSGATGDSGPVSA